MLEISCRGLLFDLSRARRQAPFLDDVNLPTHVTANVTMVLLRRPDYRALFEGYLELHRAAAVRIEDPALDAPLDNLPRLYHLWATLHVIDTADHSFHLLKSSGKSDGEVLRELAQTVRTWAEGLPRGPA